MDKKMHPEIKQQWVTALRSGKYQQGQGKLRKANNTFCCIGVLCDILPDELIKWDSTPSFGRYTAIPAIGHINTGNLPYELQKDLGLEGETLDTLVRLNDGITSLSFPEIADWIERHL